MSSAIREALAYPGPALVDCRVNPDEPPMPGKIRYEQAKEFTEAFLRGEPHKVSTLATVARDKFNELRS